ncbi:MAG: tetratricopeptide repeat protein [Planctomycetes bacterium]|nr:tetratricopeptide repeat protein [Planctomycetota bacterium]
MQTTERLNCHARPAEPAAREVALPLIGARPTVVRPSRMSRWRAGTLIAVHLLMIAHVVHWLAAGRTLSPVEPSEAMYTLNHGHLNAGFLFFAAAILGTLIFGRFVCGWGCHFIAYQDLCSWLLKKLGIKPKPLRSRILVLAPLALALYMFVWPSAYRWWVGIPPPPLTNHLLKADFWETFPGPIIAAITVLAAGGFIVYFLGSKGFCTYACPYGGFFGLADQLSPGRILVTDACEHCGHCTAACSSNVRVHEEVALYGMVVDPGCMKCMDCVSVCPNDALYFGFARPSVGRKPSAPRRPTNYDFTLVEELLMFLTGLGTLLALRGLYDHVPLLLAMGLGAMTGYMVVKLFALAPQVNVRWQNLSLKRGRSLTRAGVIFAAAAVVWLAFVGHSAVVRYSAWRGHLAVEELALPDDVWAPGFDWYAKASPPQRARLARASARLERAHRWGLLPTNAVLADLTWVYMAAGRTMDAAVAMVRLRDRAPELAAPHRGLACIYRKAGRPLEAESAYRRALELDPRYEVARREFVAFLIAAGRPADAVDVLHAAIAVDSSNAAAHYDLGMALLGLRRIGEAVQALREATRLAPKVAIYHYNLAVATFMSGRPTDALPHIREAVRLAPDDPQARGFLNVVQENLDGAATSEQDE